MDKQNLEVKRSEFVTMLAWVFIGLSSLAAAVAAAQVVLVWVVFPAEMFTGLSAQARGQLPPPGVQFMLENFRGVSTGFLMVALAALAGSIGLLKRMNWGRLMVIGFLGVAVLWNAIGLVFQVLTFNAFHSLPGVPHTGLIFGLVLVLSGLFVVAISAAFAWLIKKLLSPAIAKEFGVV
jgi:hypothetical protein